MHVIYAVLSTFIFLIKLSKAQQENSTATNGTILQLLNDTTTSPALKFVQFLQSSPDYQPIVDLLSDASSNITLFVPFDQVYYEATGEQPPASPTDPNNNTTDGNTTNPTTTSSFGEPTSITPSSSSLVSILPFSSSTPISSPTPQTTPLFSIPNLAKYYVRIPRGNTRDSDRILSMRASALFKPDEARPLNIRKANWESVTTNAACVDQFSYADIIRYHLVNGSFALTNGTMVLDSLLVNTTINKWGSGSPLVVQQGSNLTVGTGLGNDAHILSNRTIQASNGVIYVIDKILVPPVNSADTLKILPNATFFSWLLSRSSLNATLDTNNNMTFFVPTNDALVNLDFTVLNNETIDNFVKSHIVPGVYYTTNLTDQPVTVNSLAGTNFTLANPDPSNNQTATVNGTQVVHSNIILNNGVMQLINGILNFPVPQPPGSNPDDNPPNVGPFPSPVNGSSASKLFTPKLNSAFIVLLFSMILF